ncbi:MAG: hypothetical protein J6X70_08545 [Muribaculaceae bacterium]|nr:hypothetical protein [Muribaculaceae bacterium]
MNKGLQTYVFLALFVLLVCCDRQEAVNAQEKANNTTNVYELASKDWPMQLPWPAKEYFLKNGDSLSVLSIHATIVNEENMSKVSFRIDCSKGIGIKSKNKPYFALNTENGIRVFEQTIDTVFSHYGCPNNIDIEYMIEEWADHTIEITGEYAKAHSNWDTPGVNLQHKDIEKIIIQTAFYNELKSVLERRGYRIDEASPWLEHPYLIEMEEYKNDLFSISSNQWPPFPYIINGSVVISAVRDTTVDNGFEPMKAESGELTKLINKLLP